MLDHLELPAGDGPVYQRLADAIGDRIARGELSEGDRLPPHREIARALGINVTTVTRAFATLQERGLVEARPGRGTLIAPRDAEEPSFKSAPSDEAGLVDLSVNRPATTAYIEAATTLLPRLSKDRRFASLQDYHPPEGPLWARTAVAAWLDGVAGDGDASRVVLTDGAQHGLACVLRAVAQRGDVILADAISYQGISALCRSLGLDLRGLPMDRDGMRPEAFEAACANWRPRAVFLIPSLHNPTTTTLSEERRRALAQIARAHNVLIIEDDVYRPLLESSPPSFAALEPELTIHVSCLSKCIAPGLRYGFVVAPRAVLGHVAAALRIDCWSISPLTALIATSMLEDGAAARIVEIQREELRRRQTVLREALAGFDVQTNEIATHAWLHLPEPWRAAAFARACRQRGVGVLPADAFAVGREILTHAVRINLGAAPTLAALRQALFIIAELLRSGDIEVSGAI
ncbi:PLP-dependent aminotransferase family protein [Terrarubrum flagellatum]|uniref:aminotransferase-like domain-containing protein n=1 Tax=Terrirubrum flagellatum TaxID=2895980 RepID=UPI00314554B2